MAGNVRVRFLETREVRDHCGEVIAEFVEGEIYSLAPLSAQRWIRRYAAERVPTKTKARTSTKKDGNA